MVAREIRQPQRSRAFTLVEMIVVIGIIGVLLSILVPALKGIQAESKSATCMTNLRQLYAALDSYRAAQRDILPMCEFIPVATDEGPKGGLPTLLKGYVPIDCECWRCVADLDEAESLSTGTSYIYIPGLIRYTPQIQLSVFQAMLPYILDHSHTQAQIDKLRLEAEARMVTSFYNMNPAHYALLSDSQDRHDYGDRFPRNGLYMDGSARIMETKLPKPPDEQVPTGGD